MVSNYPPDKMGTEVSDTYFYSGSDSVLQSNNQSVSQVASDNSTFPDVENGPNQPDPGGSSTTLLDIKAKLSKRKFVLNLEGSITYTWSNLTCSTLKSCKNPFKKQQQPKLLLNNVSGAVQSGQLLALMGSSGAGKTTLLNLLNHRSLPNTKVSGDRYLNGVPAIPGVISSISAYIQQSDLFLPLLKVKEHLRFCSMVRMPGVLSQADRKARVDEVMKELGLWNIRNNYIGGSTTFKGISGGEQKRLAFASEILTDPNILFADEPCSGLDAFMAQNLVNMMKRMAERGKAIICTVHQPSSEVFSMFDHLCLLSEGRCAYMGPNSESLDFFDSIGYKCPSTHNPSDFFIRTLAILPDSVDESRERSLAIVNAFGQTDLYKEVVELAKYREDDKSKELQLIEKQAKGKNNRYKSSWCTQLGALIWRSFWITFRQPMLVLVRLVQNLLVGLLVGLIFYQLRMNITGASSMAALCYLTMMINSIFPAFAVINTFSMEIPIFLRENWNGMYWTSNYFIAKIIIEFPLFFLSPIFYILPVFFLTGMLGGAESFAWHFLTIGLVAIGSCSYGYFCSCATNSVALALTVNPVLMSPFFLFSGFYLDEKGLVPALSWIKYLKYGSWIFYGVENVMVKQFEDLDEVFDDDAFIPALFGDGKEVIEYFNYTLGNFGLNFLGLIGMAVVWLVLAYVSLLRRTFRK